VCWIRFEAAVAQAKNPRLPWRSANGGGGAKEGNKYKEEDKGINAKNTERSGHRGHGVRKRKEKDPVRLTTADLVLLSLLAERPMHGYQANAELVRREVQDWAGISRPQVYYSLEKLARLGMLRKASDKREAEGPERQVYAVTEQGKQALGGCA